LASSPIRILHLEDDPEDAELALETLRAAGIGCDVERVATAAAFEAALERGHPAASDAPFDLVLADDVVPGFDGKRALALARRVRPDLPYIVLSGVIGEEQAIDLLHAGATDYVLKQRLPRLGPAVRRALRERALAQEHEAAVARMADIVTKLEQKQLLDLILENMPTGVVVARAPDGLLLAVNRKATSIIGRSAEEMTTLHEITRAQAFLADGRRARPEDSPALRALTRGEIVRDILLEFRHPGGSVFAQVNASPVRDASGHVVAVVGTYADVTAQRGLQESLEGERARAARVARFPEENPDPVLGIAADLTVAYANPAGRLVLGLTPGGPIAPWMTEAAREALALRRGVRTEVRVGDRSFSVHFVPAGAEVNVYAQDVTDRKRIENRLRRLYESAMIGVLDWGTDGAITGANDRFLEMLGYTREDLEAGRIDWVRLTPPEWRHLDEKALGDFARTGASPPFEKEYLRKDGTRLPIIVGGAMLDEARREGVAFVVDISQQKAMERALRDGEERLRATFDRAALGIVELDARDRFVAVNDRMCEILGRPRDELVGETIRDLTAPEDRPLTDRTYADVHEGRSERVEYEKRYLRGDGTTLWVHVTVSALRDASGRFRGAIGTVGDISERKAAEAERDALVEALRDADRRKNEFLGMLSHELRNPLAPIRNSLYILGRAAPGGEQARRALAVIDRQVQHTTRLVDDLLDVTRITRGKVRLQRERLDLGELARRTAEDHRELFSKNGLRLEVRLAQEPAIVNADPTRIAQVIGNLLQNAVKFTPRGGETLLAVERGDGFAAVTVRDTGAGIAPEVLPRLFEPFVQGESTLDRSTGGLGLGLALVKGLAELHGGTARAQSDGAGKGTTVSVRLPLERRRTPRLTVVPSRPAPRTSRRVLVIEDNIDAAETLKEALELNGHVVDVALTGSDGLEKVESSHPDVVLCDIGLPGMDGFQVARRIRADPKAGGVALIALSGYAQAEDVERSREAGFDLHLAKPPDLETLERAIAEARSAAAERVADGAAIGPG
jgi:PAS domain S-box-containing protein